MKKFYGNFGSSEEKVYLIDNLTMLLGSGMDISLALKAVKSEIKSVSLKKAIDDIGEDVNNGTPLWRAFENVGIFPGYVISLVRIGEESGKLSQNLKIIAAQQEKDKIFKSKIRSAMLYPSLVVFLTIFIGTGIAWFILPKLSTVFDSLTLELPLITKILIEIGGYLGKYGTYAITVFLFSITAIFYIVFIFNKPASVPATSKTSIEKVSAG